MIFRAIVAAAVAITFNPGLLHAQTFRGAIQGTVNDSSGSAVPNAQVTVTGEQTQFARQAVTGASGTYLFTELPVGSYKVTATKSGFQKQVVRHRRKDCRFAACGPDADARTVDGNHRGRR